MPTPEQIVTDFVTSWGNSTEDLVYGARTFFTENTYWETTGAMKTTGIDAAIQVMEGFVASTGAALVRCDILSIMSRGDTILLERLEHFLDADGNEFLQLPVMASFRVSGGKIVRWVDYFNAKIMDAVR